MDFLDPKYVEVYRARNLPEAHSIRIALEESGIRVQIEGELLQGAVGDLPIGWATAPRILVEQSQITAARQIIEQVEIQARAGSHEDELDEVIRCLACGRNMAEGEVNCRSCGWSYQGEENSGEQETTEECATKNGSEAAPKPMEASQSIPISPQLTQRALWWEVLAVLTIGVFPHLISAFAFAWDSHVIWPFWAESVARCLQSACISFAVLYLIHRSGESWATFGIKPPLLRDIPLGGLVYLANVFLLLFASNFLVMSIREPGDFSLPQRGTDYLLMVAKFSASAFTEELVTRAYLITRFERLLRSSVKAVALSAALFASYHLYYGVEALIETMVLGLGYGFLYLLIRRIWPFAIGHTLWNVLATLRILP